jgi:AcrR family transcriptional regulator
MMSRKLRTVPAAGDPDSSSREKIIDTSEALFARHGYAGVGLSEVAERVGLRKSSLFHHFPSKATLYVAVLERVLGSIHERVRAALEREGSPLVRLERWLDSLLDTLAENPQFAPLLLRALFEKDVTSPDETRGLDEALDRILGGVRTVLEAGVASGSFRPLSVPHMLQSLIGMTIYHFASGELGERLLGRPVYSAEEVRRRKREIQALLRSGLRPAHV